jgi:hypothetical protein
MSNLTANTISDLAATTTVFVTDLATKTYVTSNAATATPQPNGTAAVDTSTKYAREDHVHAISSSGITLGTAQTASNNTFFDFTGIPSTAKRITVSFGNVSTNGTWGLTVQVGAGSIDTAGYSSSASNGNGGVSTGTITNGFLLMRTTSAGAAVSGHLTLTHLGGNYWVASGVAFDPIAGPTYGHGAGAKILSGSLDRLRITTVNGTDQFDSGTVNIMWEV